MEKPLAVEAKHALVTCLTGLGSAEVRPDGGADLEVTDTHPVGGTYRGPRRGFIVSFDDAMRGEADTLCLARVLGWRPGGDVSLAAWGKQRHDHRILAEIAVFCADRVGGLVDFCGELWPLGRFWSMVHWRADSMGRRSHMERVLAALPGRHWTLPYSVEGRLNVAHIGDVEFTRAWMAHRHFHMVK